MARYGKWETIKELGRGGQGTAYLAKDTEKTSQSERLLDSIRESVLKLKSMQDHETGRRMAESLAEAISALAPKGIDPSAICALKVLHRSKDIDSFEKAKGRMRSEIKALSDVDHPNVLKVLDQNIDEGWFVGEYQLRGSLSKNQSLFKGNIVAALQAFRPLVEGVIKLHEVGLVHRDIKPDNVFIADDGRLVLGDLGIVFFVDSNQTRMSDTYENVGSRDWMPAWPFGMRIEEIKPSFDVFCLGKLFWAMVSGRTKLQLWYHHEDEFELEKMFPNDESIRWARGILDPCIVEKENDCLQTSAGLLEIIDPILIAVSRHAQVVGDSIRHRCEVCGIGIYNPIPNNDNPRNFGLNPAGSREFKIYSCSHCGHVQLFHIPNPPNVPPAWK